MRLYSSFEWSALCVGRVSVHKLHRLTQIIGRELGVDQSTQSTDHSVDSLDLLDYFVRRRSHLSDPTQINSFLWYTKQIIMCR